MGAPSYDTTRRIASVRQRAAEGAASTVGVPDDIDGVARIARHGFGDGRDILELALDRVGQRVAGRATAASVDGVDGE